MQSQASGRSDKVLSFDPYAYVERERERRRALVEYVKRLRETPVGQYLHFKDERLCKQGITVLPVFRYEGGRYYVHYYLKYGTEKPLEALTPDDILYIDKKLPRVVHWALVNHYHEYFRSSYSMKVSRYYIYSVMLREQTRRHFYQMSFLKRPLVNMITLHALLSFYTAVRNRVQGIDSKPHHPSRFVHNPLKFAVHKINMREDLFQRLVNEPFDLEAPGSTELLEGAMRLARALHVTPDALVGYPVLLLIHPTNKNVTIVLPHKTAYPVTMERAMVALGGLMEPFSFSQFSEVIREVHKDLVASMRRVFERQKAKGRIKALRLDYRRIREVVTATMERIEQRRCRMRKRQRQIWGREAIERFMKLFPPTGELAPEIQKALEKETAIRKRLQETGEKRSGARPHGFRRSYDYDI